jgi:hypothetical protein
VTTSIPPLQDQNKGSSLVICRVLGRQDVCHATDSVAGIDGLLLLISTRISAEHNVFS